MQLYSINAIQLFYWLQWGRAQVSAEMGRLQVLNFQRSFARFASGARRSPKTPANSYSSSQKPEQWQGFLPFERDAGFQRHLAARAA